MENGVRLLEESRDVIPPNYSIFVELPAQFSLTETIVVEVIVSNVGEAAETIFFTSLLFATLFNLSM